MKKNLLILKKSSSNFNMDSNGEIIINVLLKAVQDKVPKLNRKFLS